MLVASGSARFGSGAMRSRFVLTPRLCVHLVERSHLTFDVRFVPAAPGASHNAIVYLLLDGVFEVLSPAPRRLEGPVAFVLHEDAFEGANDRRDLLFRSLGPTYRAVELRLAASELHDVPGNETRVLALGAAGWDAIGRLHAAEPGARDAFAGALREVLGELTKAGILADDPSASLADVDPRSTRLWSVLRPLAERFQVLPTLDELALGSGLSVRQLTREVTRFIGAFSLPGPVSGWRDVTRRLRLKLAVVGLSAPDATVVEVAHAAGYADGVAMARAFRDVGLPPPAEVRAHLGATAPR